MISKKLVYLPLGLTLTRLIFSPLILPLILVYGLPYNSWLSNGSIGFLFACLGATDFFDGYFARKYNVESTEGRILDPIADKFLLYATLISLAVAHKLYFYWAIIWIGREFFIMSLRYLALEYKISVHVSVWGKLKTACQLFTLLYIILNPYQNFGLSGAPIINGIEVILLFASTYLTLYSAYSYYQCARAQFHEKQSKGVDG